MGRRRPEFSAAAEIYCRASAPSSDRIVAAGRRLSWLIIIGTRGRPSCAASRPIQTPRHVPADKHLVAAAAAAAAHIALRRHKKVGAIERCARRDQVRSRVCGRPLRARVQEEGRAEYRRAPAGGNNKATTCCYLNGHLLLASAQNLRARKLARRPGATAIRPLPAKGKLRNWRLAFGRCPYRPQHGRQQRRGDDPTQTRAAALVVPKSGGVAFAPKEKRRPAA